MALVLMVYVLAVAIPALWVVAFVVQRRVAAPRLWLRYDMVVGVVAGVLVAAREGAGRGLLVGVVALPLLALFSAVRTVHMRYIDRKTQAMLDDAPGMRAAYERRDVPSRRERLASRDGND